ncbi:hypothetical protein TURU_160804 [Turdus rufiventris]|nr:hypothetical protein TURU_160804 [Turdus rufiventris]
MAVAAVMVLLIVVAVVTLVTVVGMVAVLVLLMLMAIVTVVVLLILVAVMVVALVTLVAVVSLVMLVALLRLVAVVTMVLLVQISCVQLSLTDLLSMITHVSGNGCVQKLLHAGYQQYGHRVQHLLAAPTKLFHSLGEEDLTFTFHQIPVRKISLIPLLQAQSLDIWEEAKTFVKVLPHGKGIFWRAL